MGFLDRLLGRDSGPGTRPDPRSGASGSRSEDEIAVERYRYLLRTAPPETIEQVHEEAFSRLSPEQRRRLFEELSRNAATGDQPASDDPHSLAQSATRSELRRPGSMERTMSGPSFASTVGGSMLGTVAGFVIASALVNSFLPPDPGADPGADGGADAQAEGGADAGDGGGDFGGGFGDFGSGDFGGGDFGGGDFGI